MIKISNFQKHALVSIFCLLTFIASSFLVVTYHVSEYAFNELSTKNADSAVLIGLMLNQPNMDPAMTELYLTVIYDTGGYKRITLTDVAGNVVMDKENVARAAIPWLFMEAMPISSIPGRAKITKGWTQAGTLTIISSETESYLMLWNTAVFFLYMTIVLFGILAGILITTHKK